MNGRPPPPIAAEIAIDLQRATDLLSDPDVAGLTIRNGQAFLVLNVARGSAPALLREIRDRRRG